jgi:tetratricopeptide (TPR) repeat protein
MANVAALKKKAAEFEAKKQLEKAIATYREVLDAYDSGSEADAEIALYNRVGDLLTRQGNVAEAVTLYERAVDLYTEGGFFNNAIALCNKVLRTSPGRASIYYKLGKISAAKGFKGEAKQNFLEYADRMQKAGSMDEAFRALKEFADLVPDQDDVRLMLAEQLTKADRKTEAIAQLQQLYGRYEADGRAAEAQATAERMKAIDPTFEPKAGEGKSEAKADDLIFIDLDAPAKPRGTRGMPRIVEPPTGPKSAPAAPAPEPVAPPAAAPVEAPAPEPLAAEGWELISAAVEGSADVAPPDAGSMLGLEPTSFGESTVSAEPEPMAPKEFAEIDLSAIPEAPTVRAFTSRDLALGGDLPLLDVGAAPEGGELLDLDVSTTGASAELQMIDLGADADLGVEPTLIEPEATASPDLPLINVVEDAPPAPPALDEIEAAPVEPTTFGEVAAELVEEAPPPVRRASSLLAANSVMTLRVKVADEPENWQLHRQLAEALLEDGERDEGMKELETALAGFDKANDPDNATSIVDEIVRISPASVRYHQKRVEYAFRANDKARTVEAYVALADALFRDAQADRARQVYQRVLDLAPGESRALAALETLGGPAPAAPAAAAPQAAAPAPRTSTTAKRYTGAIESVKAEEPAAKGGGDDDYVSLGDWLREDEGPKSTRMVVEEQEPTGDEQADFADMLKKFKQGISENVEDDDHEAHYDLGVAYKEMGLVDEAIAEFQKALRGTQNRARTFEALGQCFLEKKQLPVATTILQRALSEPGIGDEQLVGVLYLLGYIHESLSKWADAKAMYERVFAADIKFRDVGDRLNAVDKAAK